MNSFTDIGSRINNNRSYLHSAPAVILAVSLLLGCLGGRITTDQNPKWLPAAVPVITILALAQPSPLALGTLGFSAGVALESLRADLFKEVPFFGGQDFTLKGRVVQKRPGFFGEDSLKIRVSEVRGRGPKTVNFLLRINVPQEEDVKEGSEIVFRAALGEKYLGPGPPVIRGRAVAASWLPASSTLSPVTMGRVRLLKVLHSLRDRAASGLLGAVSLGERWRVGPGTRDILRRTGTYHLLAISGVHVGAAILPFLFLSRMSSLLFLRIRPRFVKGVMLIATLCAIGNYLSFTGTSAPALRATAYLVLASAASVAGRYGSPLANLSWCVMVLICFSSGRQPDLSLVLSGLAVTGIVLSGRGPGGSGLWRTLHGMVRMTLGAILFTLPVTVWLAGGVSVAALWGNILAGFTFGLFLIPWAVIMDGAALLQGFPLDALVRLWVAAGDSVLGIMAHLAEMQLSFLTLSPAGCAYASAAAIAAILVWWRKGYTMGWGVLLFAAIILVAGTGDAITRHAFKNILNLDFPPLGQADAAVIRMGGRTVLVDCGPPGPPGGDSHVSTVLQRMGIKDVDAVFLSHLHPDHAGGLDDIIARWPVKVIYLPSHYRDLIAADKVPRRISGSPGIRFLDRGDVVEVSSMVFTVLGPGKEHLPSAGENRGSMILLLEAGGYRALFTGDAHWDQVQRALGPLGNLNLMKIPHHGSRTGFPPEGMEESVRGTAVTRETRAVCPSGRPGQRPLPAPEVVRWFERRGLRILFTAQKGVKIRYKKGGSGGRGTAVVDIHDMF